MTTLNRRQFIGAAAAAGAGATAAALPAFAQQASATSSKAATIFKNARVYVGDNAGSIADAVAIGVDGRILAVGSNQAVKNYLGYATEVVDAQGGTVMAGIHDGHMHPMYGGLQALNPTLEDAELTAAEVQDLVTGFLGDPTYGTEPDAWLKVEGWNPAGTPTDTLPHKDILDALATSRPIALNGSDGHNLWANSKALQLASIDSSTPDPVGGEIVRDGGGNPTGVLKDAAQTLVSNLIPGPTPEEMYDAMAAAWRQIAAGGITTLMDAWVDPWQLDFYASLASNGDLLTRTFPAIRASAKKVGHPQRFLEKITSIADAYGDLPNVHFGIVKVFMDGVIEYPAQTAALLKPYLDGDGNPTDNYGDLYVDGPTLGRFTSVLDAAGWQLHVHAIGDGAVRAALDGYQISRQANGNTDRRHTIAHLQLVHPADYPRFAELGVIADMQLQWATRNVWTMEALKPYIGKKRWERMYPAKSLRDAGARLAGGSDWPVDPLYPWNQVQSAIDRVGLYGEGAPLGIHEAISRGQSLRMHTRGTAYQLHQDKRTGTVEVGKFADLVMLDRDVATCPVSEIKDAVPQLTMVGGDVTFDITSSAGKAARRSLERAASARALTSMPGRIRHDQLGGRHTGCPCTSATDQ
jgi:predicted amidohydrolase YtcJ